MSACLPIYRLKGDESMMLCNYDDIVVVNHDGTLMHIWGVDLEQSSVGVTTSFQATLFAGSAITTPIEGIVYFGLDREPWKENCKNMPKGYTWFAQDIYQSPLTWSTIGGVGIMISTLEPSGALAGWKNILPLKSSAIDLSCGSVKKLVKYHWWLLRKE